MYYKIVKNLLLKNPDILDDRIRINGVISDLYGEEKLISNIMMYLYDSNILKLIVKGNIIESDIKNFVKKVSNNYGIDYKRVIECFDEWFKIIDLKIAKEYLQKKSIKNYDNYILFNRLINIKRIIIEENKDYSYILIKTVNVMTKLTILLMILFIIYGFRQILINTNGWVKILNNWFYFKNSSIVKNEIIIDNDNMYCFNNYGIMFRDSFIHYNNNYYYAGENGILYRNRWIKDGHRWKYASNDGKIIKNNWIEIDGDIYIFDGFGDLYTHQWIDFGEYQYWINEEGKLQRNKWIDNHYVGNNGFVIKDKTVFSDNVIKSDILQEKTENDSLKNDNDLINENITEGQSNIIYKTKGYDETSNRDEEIRKKNVNIDNIVIGGKYNYSNTYFYSDNFCRISFSIGQLKYKDGQELKEYNNQTRVLINRIKEEIHNKVSVRAASSAYLYDDINCNECSIEEMTQDYVLVVSRGSYRNKTNNKIYTNRKNTKCGMEIRVTYKFSDNSTNYIIHFNSTPIQ